MSRQTRLFGYFGNGALALLAGLLMLVTLGRGHIGPAFILAMLCGLGFFNLRLIAKAGALTSEEEWLASELRKAEMRSKLVDMASQGLTDVVPPEVMAKRSPSDMAHTTDGGGRNDSSLR